MPPTESDFFVCKLLQAILLFEAKSDKDIVNAENSVRVKSFDY